MTKAVTECNVRGLWEGLEGGKVGRWVEGRKGMSGSHWSGVSLSVVVIYSRCLQLALTESSVRAGEGGRKCRERFQYPLSRPFPGYSLPSLPFPSSPQSTYHAPQKGVGGKRTERETEKERERGMIGGEEGASLTSDVKNNGMEEK